MSKFTKWLEEARAYYAENPSHFDFSNRFFSQNSPYMQSLTTKEERKEFTSSPEYKEIQKMCDLLEADHRDYNGSFMVRVPKSLHKALMIEAINEDVSLNQLCETKLSVSLGQILSNRVK